MASSTIADGHAFVSVCNDAPYHCATIALNPTSGTIIWRAPFGNSDSTPTFGDGKLFVSGVEGTRPGYGRTIVTALAIRSGKPLWQFRDAGDGPYTTVGSSERAIAGTYSAQTYYQAIPGQDELIAFDAASGRIRWTFKSLAPIKQSPIADGGRIYVGDATGILYVLNERSGAVITTRALNHGFSTSPPVLLGDTLFVANGTSVYAIRLN